MVDELQEARVIILQSFCCVFAKLEVSSEIKSHHESGLFGLWVSNSALDRVLLLRQ